MAAQDAMAGDDPSSHDGLTTSEISAESAPLEPGVARSRVEALLLIAKTPLSYRRLAVLAGLEDATQARTLVAELNTLYDSNGRGIRIEQIAGGSRLMTRGVVSPWLRRLGVLPEAIRLSWPMMETLAIVAYRQDVTRADVEAVRGVACGEILRQLMSLDLARISGRSEDLGRPYLYGTTKRFLQICGLASINVLPAIDSQGFCEDVSDSDEAIPAEDSSDDPAIPNPNLEPDASAGSPDPKESDVSIALTDALATDSVLSTVLTASSGHTSTGEAFAGAAASVVATTGDPVAVIEDEEDDLYEKGADDDDDDDFVDDDDDWDDDEDEDDDSEDDDSEDDDDAEDSDDDDDEEDSWEEVDDDEADENWDDDEEDDDDDEDWDDDDDEEEADDDEEPDA